MAAELPKRVSKPHEEFVHSFKCLCLQNLAFMHIIHSISFEAIGDTAAMMHLKSTAHGVACSGQPRALSSHVGRI